MWFEVGSGSAAPAALEVAGRFVQDTGRRRRL